MDWPPASDDDDDEEGVSDSPVLVVEVEEPLERDGGGKGDGESILVVKCMVDDPGVEVGRVVDGRFNEGKFDEGRDCGPISELVSVEVKLV